MTLVKSVGLAAAALFGGVVITASVLAQQPPHAPANEVNSDMHNDPVPPRQSWSFGGLTGKFDQAQLQRGFKVYREVCSNCHSMQLVAFRNLADAGGPGFTEGQVKALAAEYKVQDGPNDAGEMFERPGRPSDHIPGPFANENAARTANGGALPPDMSVLAKARSFSRGFPWFAIDGFLQYQEQGPDYIVGILNGYKDPPPGVELQPGQNYNEIMPGHKLAMPKPLNDGQVEYPDGTPTTLQQYSKDIAAFLMWTAEPKLEERKRTGLRVLIFLILFAGLLYYTKKKIWSGVAH
jgi:ubiquinol-cytochrome c reductase cytochrome b/c1 subunit